MRPVYLRDGRLPRQRRRQCRNRGEVGQIAVGGLWPDLTVILDLPVETSLARLRRRPDRMESKDLDFHRKVRQLFLQQAKEKPDRFCVVDASGEIDEVQLRLREAVVHWCEPGGTHCRI